MVKGCESNGVVDADAVVHTLGSWSGQVEVVKEAFEVSGLKAHNTVLRPSEPEKITPHYIFLSYQTEPDTRMLDPEVCQRHTSTPLSCHRRIRSGIVELNCTIC
jgi:hypothetical protein